MTSDGMARFIKAMSAKGCAEPGCPAIPDRTRVASDGTDRREWVCSEHAVTPPRKNPSQTKEKKP